MGLLEIGWFWEEEFSKNYLWRGVGVPVGMGFVF